MNFLKPLFFNKYKPKNTYSYSSEWVDISLEARHGLLSIACRYTTETPKGVIILAHPMIESGKYFFIDSGHASFYFELGYHVVLFDFNGFGQSTDRNNLDFKEDVLSVLSRVEVLFPDLPVAIHGVSFGGSQILLACIEDESRIDRMIVESAVSSNIDYYKGKGGYLFHILNAYNSFFPKRNAHNIYTDVVKQIRETPILYIYGEQDIKTPVWMGEALYKNTNSEKQLAIFQSSHLHTISEEPKAYREAISNFLGK